MLRIHCMQQWFTLSEPTTEETLQDTPLLREFAELVGFSDWLLDENTILRFRHLLEMQKLPDQILETVNDRPRGEGPMLRAGTVVDATPIAAQSSNKNRSGAHEPMI